MKTKLSRRKLFTLLTYLPLGKLLASKHIEAGTISHSPVSTSGVLEVSTLDIVTNKLNYQIYGDGHYHTVLLNDQSLSYLLKNKQIIVRSDHGNKQDHTHWVKVILKS